MFVFALIEDTTLKKKGIVVPLAILAWGLTAASAYAQTPAAVVNCGREFAKDVAGFRAAYVTATNRIPMKYMHDLEALRAKFQEAGDLDGLLAVKKEIERYRQAKAEEADPFEALPEMTPNVIVTAPPELRKLQTQYVSSFTEAAATLKNSISERGEKYLSQIKSLQTALTKAGKIDEAIAVRNEYDRVAKILRSGDLSALLGPSKASAATTGSTDRPRADGDKATVPSPTKWLLRGSLPFSRDLPRYFAPDVPNEIKAHYNPAKGIATFSGKCQTAAAQVGDVLCSWNGSAILWDVPDIDSLATAIRIKSRTLSKSAYNGPQLEMAILLNRAKIASISVPICKTEDLVKIVRDASNGNRFSLFWPLGSKSVLFEVPSGARVNVLIGVVLHNPGEECDLSFQFEGPDAK